MGRTGSLVPIGIDSHRLDNLGAMKERVNMGGIESKGRFRLRCASSTDYLPP